MQCQLRLGPRDLSISRGFTLLLELGSELCDLQNGISPKDLKALQ